MAIDKNSKHYQSLLNKGYTDDQITQMVGAVSSGQSAKDVIANTKVSTPTSTATTSAPKNTTNTTTVPSANTAKPEYQGSGTRTQSEDKRWRDGGNGDYYYNTQSGYYEKKPTSTTQTSTTSITPSTSTSNYPNADKIRQGWDNMTYEQQQEALKKNPALKENVIRVGGTIKTVPTTGTPNTPANVNNVKPKNSDGSNWDYQDNSQARMDEIQDNLDRYRITNPGLFDNYDDFYNFFLAGKGRTPEQEKVINDYFKRINQYNKYDNMSSDSVGQGLVNGTIPDSYLSYIKNTDPQRWAEIQEARKNAESQIMNENYLYDMAESAGFDMGGNSFLQWNKETFGLEDKNKDGLWDTIYHAPTQEELDLNNEDNEYEAEKLKIKNAYKDLTSDLTEQYPDADLSTIMILASDRGNKMMKALDTISVAQTKTQGRLKYLQEERATMDKAGQTQILDIQKNLGMYYDYTPQGMSERAQAEYAATNVTLDQADNGTDTQKQMALDRVLSDYYDKYGSIIQRSKSQVINDVMAYAKKNGVSLSQALEDNFLKFLRQKPGFEQLSSYGGGNPDVFKIGEDTYGYWDENGNLVPIGGNLGGGYNPTGGLFGYSDYTPITSQQLTNGIDKFMSQHPLNSDGGQCGSFVNDYLQSLGYDRLYDDPIDKKKAITNSDTPVKGAIAVMDSKNYPQYGHTAIVTDVRGDKVHLLESNWGDDEKVHERWVNKSDILGYFDPSKSSTTPKDVLNNKFTGDPDWNQNGYFNGLVPYFNTLIKDGKLDLTDTKYKEKLKDYGITDKEFDQMAQNYANTELKGNGGSQASRALEMAIKTYEYLYGPSSQELGWMPNGSTWLGRQVSGLAPFSDVGKAKTEFESMLNRLTLKELFDAKALGATFGAMSKDEWDVLANAATDVKWGAGNFKENMEDLIESLYTATIDGNAQLPKNWDGSQAQNMVNNRITNGTSLGNYGNATTTKSSTSRFNAPTYATNQSTLNGEIDWDSIWNQ